MASKGIKFEDAGDTFARLQEKLANDERQYYTAEKATEIIDHLRTYHRSSIEKFENMDDLPDNEAAHLAGLLVELNDAISKIEAEATEPNTPGGISRSSYAKAEEQKKRIEEFFGEHNTSSTSPADPTTSVISEEKTMQAVQPTVGHQVMEEPVALEDPPQQTKTETAGQVEATVVPIATTAATTKIEKPKSKEVDPEYKTFLDTHNSFYKSSEARFNRIKSEVKDSTKALVQSQVTAYARKIDSLVRKVEEDGLLFKNVSKVLLKEVQVLQEAVGIALAAAEDSVSKKDDRLITQSANQKAAPVEQTAPAATEATPKGTLLTFSPSGMEVNSKIDLDKPIASFTPEIVREIKKERPPFPPIQIEDMQPFLSAIHRRLTHGVEDGVPTAQLIATYVATQKKSIEALQERSIAIQSEGGNENIDAAIKKAQQELAKLEGFELNLSNSQELGKAVRNAHTALTEAAAQVNAMPVRGVQGVAASEVIPESAESTEASRPVEEVATPEQLAPLEELQPDATPKELKGALAEVIKSRSPEMASLLVEISSLKDKTNAAHMKFLEYLAFEDQPNKQTERELRRVWVNYRQELAALQIHGAELRLSERPQSREEALEGLKLYKGRGSIEAKKIMERYARFKNVRELAITGEEEEIGARTKALSAKLQESLASISQKFIDTPTKRKLWKTAALFSLISMNSGTSISSDPKSGLLTKLALGADVPTAELQYLYTIQGKPSNTPGANYLNSLLAAEGITQIDGMKKQEEIPSVEMKKGWGSFFTSFFRNDELSSAPTSVEEAAANRESSEEVIPSTPPQRVGHARPGSARIQRQSTLPEDIRDMLAAFEKPEALPTGVLSQDIPGTVNYAPVESLSGEAVDLSSAHDESPTTSDVNESPDVSPGAVESFKNKHGVEIDLSLPKLYSWKLPKTKEVFPLVIGGTETEKRGEITELLQIRQEIKYVLSVERNSATGKDETVMYKVDNGKLVIPVGPVMLQIDSSGNGVTLPIPNPEDFIKTK